jgi:hypothetical protein
VKPKISVQIATVFREKGYVHQTVDSLRSSGFFDDPENLPLHLVVGLPQSSYLDQYRNSPKEFHIDEMTEAEAARLKMADLTGMQKAALTHSRCLEEARMNGGASLVLVIEDDVRFAKGWMERLQKALDSVICEFGMTWVMCLYTPLTDEPTQAYQRGKAWYRKNYEWFFGTQGTLYPRDIGQSFAAEIRRKCVDPYVAPYDITLAQFMKAEKIPIVATAPCLVQHIGDVSHGVCNHFHQSKSFMEVIPKDLPG